MKKVSRTLAVLACGLVIGFVIPRGVIPRGVAGTVEVPLEIKFPMPPKPVMPITDRAFCRGIVESWIDAGVPNSFVTQKYIRGKISKGTDTISIGIEGNQMHLLTQAGLESGSTKDESPAEIVTNSPELVVAITTYGRDKDTPIYDIFSLNKRTGIGLWSKVFTAEPLSENPVAENTLFVCEAR